MQPTMDYFTNQPTIVKIDNRNDHHQYHTIHQYHTYTYTIIPTKCFSYSNHKNKNTRQLQD
jgi:hypothetical protein